MRHTSLFYGRYNNADEDRFDGKKTVFRLNENFTAIIEQAKQKVSDDNHRVQVKEMGYASRRRLLNSRNCFMADRSRIIALHVYKKSTSLNANNQFCRSICANTIARRKTSHSTHGSHLPPSIVRQVIFLTILNFTLSVTIFL